MTCEWRSEMCDMPFQHFLLKLLQNNFNIWTYKVTLASRIRGQWSFISLFKLPACSLGLYWKSEEKFWNFHTPEGGGGILFYLCPSVLPSVQDIFRRIFLSNCWLQKSDIWWQASYRYTILWVAFLDPSDSYFLFSDFVDFYTHWTYMLIFRRIFLSNYWWQKSDIWSQASYTYVGTPYRGKRFLTRQIPTSCLPKRGGIIGEH